MGHLEVACFLNTLHHVDNLSVDWNSLAISKTISVAEATVNLRRHVCRLQPHGIGK